MIIPLDNLNPIKQSSRRDAKEAIHKMLTASVDMSGFQAGMRGLVQKCRLESKVVVKKELGELIKELVLRSPPKSPKKTRDAIAAGINYKFTAIADDRNSDQTGLRGGWKVGASGIRWYAVDSKFLHGIAPQNDMRKASVADLAKLRFLITKSGRFLNQPFKDRKTSQRTLISQTILTKEGTRNKLISKVRQNVGRLKAGWLVAVRDGVVAISGAKMPPAWVTKHVTPATRGRVENGLEKPGNPTITIANSAKGITQKGVDFIVQLAVKSRAASMVSNARRIFYGQKRLADYAR